jgi:hypothetical protein
MGHEAVQLDEGAGIEQYIEALARRHLALLVLRGDALRTAALLGFRALLLKKLELFSHSHGLENVGPEIKRGQDNLSP